MADFYIFNTLLGNTSVFYIDWLIASLYTVLTLPIITRNVSKWPSLAFPVSIMYFIAGMNVSTIQMVITGYIFALQVISIQQITAMIGSATDIIFKTTKGDNIIRTQQKLYKIKKATNDQIQASQEKLFRQKMELEKFKNSLYIARQQGIDTSGFFKEEETKVTK